jgi:hypothetical protein
VPIHEKVLAEFKKRGYDITDPVAMQFQAGGGDSRQNHGSWHWTLNILKERREEDKMPFQQTVVAAKRVIDPKSKKEYVLVTFQIEGQHYNNEKITDRWTEKGVYRLPTFKRAFDAKKMRWVETDEVLGSTDNIYEYPFKGAKTEIEDVDGKWRPITDFITTETKWHVKADNAIKLKVTQEDWLSMKREDLLAKYENRSPQSAAIEGLTKTMKQAFEAGKL